MMTKIRMYANIGTKKSNYCKRGELKYSLLLLFSTISTYMCGLLVDKFNQSEKDNSKIKKSIPMVICIVINLLILFIFKYYNFSVDIVERLLLKIGIEFSVPTFDVIICLNISILGILIFI